MCYIRSNQIKYKVNSERPAELMQIDLIKPLVIDSVIQNRKNTALK